VIRNNDTDTSVWYSSKEGDILAASFQIGPGKELEIFHNDAVWLEGGTDGDSVVTSVSVLAEFEVDDR
jgi:hypothetical protein